MDGCAAMEHTEVSSETSEKSLSQSAQGAMQRENSTVFGFDSTPTEETIMRTIAAQSNPPTPAAESEPLDPPLSIPQKFSHLHITHSTSSPFIPDKDCDDNDPVVREYLSALNSDEDMAVAVAAIKALTCAIANSAASTMMELEKELKAAADSLRRCNRSSITLAAGCELFMRYVTRTGALEHADLSQSRQRLIERGKTFSAISMQAREKIAELGQRFVREGGVVLVHGFSRVVLALLKEATRAGKQFTVMVTEGRPNASGCRMAEELIRVGIPTTLVLDSAAAYMMERVDMVLVGSEGVVENGGIINKIGTFQIATVAKALGKPVYVAAESYKFARLYPLNQRDLPYEQAPGDTHSLGLAIPDGLEVVNPGRDYTPPDRLTLLFTDLGVLTPSAVSDELIQLYL